MKVRRARISDMAAIVDYMAAYHPTSNLSSVPFVRKDVVKVVEYHITHRDTNPLVAFSEEGVLIGMLFAELVPYFFNSKYYFASDLQFISDGAGMHLLREFKEWAKSVGAHQIIMGVSSGDPRADSFLELSGLEKTGNMYVLHW